MVAEPKTRLRVSADWIAKVDLLEVVEIANSAYALQRTAAEFRDMLKQDRYVGIKLTGSDPANGPGVLFPQILGYMVYRLEPTRYELLELAIDSRFRRLGLGRELLEGLTGKVSPVMRRSEVRTFVHHENLPGQCWLRACGWKAYDLQKDHWGAGEDAYVFRFRPVQQSLK